jgi:hypothetical protein
MIILACALAVALTLTLPETLALLWQRCRRPR